MKLLERVGRLSRFTIITAGLSLVALLGVAQYLSGPDVSFLIFYTAPVFLAAWYAAKRHGKNAVRHKVSDARPNAA